MGNNNSQPRVVVKAKGRGPIPPAIQLLQNPEFLNTGITTPAMLTGTAAAYPPPIMPVPLANPMAAPPMMATATTTDTVLSGPMLPPRLPPVPMIDHPMQPGIYGATAVGPSVAETYVVQHQPFVAGGGPGYLDEAAIFNASAPMQPSPMPSPQPSPPATMQQQQLFLQQQQHSLTPPLPAGYADQTEFYQGNAAYANDNEASDDDDSGSYTSFEEEVFVAPARRDLPIPSYTQRRSPNFMPTATTRIRDSPQPLFVREATPPLYVRESPTPLSARTRAAYAAVETPYDRYNRSRAYERYQERVNSRMSAYEQVPDRYGFYPNAYRI